MFFAPIVATFLNIGYQEFKQVKLNAYANKCSYNVITVDSLSMVSKVKQDSALADRGKNIEIRLNNDFSCDSINYDR